MHVSESSVEGPRASKERQAQKKRRTTQPDFMNVQRPDVVAFISVMYIRLEEYRWLTTDPIAIYRIYRGQDEPAEEDAVAQWIGSPMLIAYTWSKLILSCLVTANQWPA